MSVRPILAGTQPPDHLSISTTNLLIIFILIIVATEVYRHPKLAPPIGAACAVGALLVVVLMG
ncbi:hypothetical protein AB0C74_11660 [Spirillospora sp. NPDC048832]